MAGQFRFVVPFEDRWTYNYTAFVFLFGILGCESEELIDPQESTPSEDLSEKSDDSENNSLEIEANNEDITKPNKEEEGTTSPNFTLEWVPGEKPSEGIFWEIEEEENSILLQISAIELKDIFGIAFHIHYNPDVLRYVDGQSTEILRDPKADTASLIREGKIGEVYFGSVRLHEPKGGGQGIAYTGLDLPKGIIASFRFEVIGAGDALLNIAEEGRDIRNSDLEPMTITLQGGKLKVQTEVVP